MFISENPVRIDAGSTPKVELRLLCATVLEAVKRFYDDPENIKNFEAWQQRKQQDDTRGKA